MLILAFYKSTVLDTRVSKEKVNIVRVNSVNTAGQTAVSTVKGNGVTAVKASAGYVWRPKINNLNNGSKDNSGSWISKRVNYIDPQGRLKHMTGNKALLTDYQDIDGGFVAFGGSTRGGKITGQGPNWLFDLDSLTNSMNYQPVNTASASRTFSHVGPSSGPSFVPFSGSFPIDIANLPHDPLTPELEDTA
ncbi:hypothetical protein Tco_0807935, partial [Tanacetum coccineum]